MLTLRSANGCAATRGSRLDDDAEDVGEVIFLVGGGGGILLAMSDVG